MKALLLRALLFISLVTGCQNNSSDGGLATAEVAADNVSQVAVPAKKTYEADQKIVREANIRFKTDDLQQSYNQIAAAVRKHHAVVHNDVEGKEPDAEFRNVTVRLPGGSFDAFIADISKGVAYFDRKEISAEDVTTQYIDLEARLKAKKALEARYIELLGKAGKVSDMLEIERELAKIREEIESQEGQLRYLKDRVSLSTIKIEIYKPLALGGGVTASYAEKMWTAIKSGFNGISAFFIGLLYIWPLIVILAVLFFIVRRKLRKKTLSL